MLRQARMEDQHMVVLLMHTAIGDFVNVFTGEWDMKKALSNMAVLFNKPGNRFSKEYCTIVERDDVAVGQIIAYPADQIAILNGGVIKALRESYKGPADELALIERQIINSEEAFEGEYYIDSVAVMPAFRGQGVGKELISHAEKLGKAEGYSKISLLAEDKNEKAFNIYKALGYVHDCDLEVMGHTFKHMIKKV